MERKIVLATHGRFASGIYDSLCLILGEDQTISVLDAYTTDDFDLSYEVSRLIDQGTERELVILTDLFGGSVNNEFMKYIDQPNVHLIAGLNLPLLIELSLKLKLAGETDLIIKKVLAELDNHLIYCNMLDQGKQIAEEEF